MRKRLLSLFLLLLIPAVAFAQGHTYVTGLGATVQETIACNSGVSPCISGTTSTTVLNATVTVLNAGNRKECLLQNVGTTDFYCLKGAGTASTTSMHFILNAASAANKAGSSYSCNQGLSVWSGAIQCVSSATGGVLTVSAD